MSSTADLRTSSRPVVRLAAEDTVVSVLRGPGTAQGAAALDRLYGAVLDRPPNASLTDVVDVVDGVVLLVTGAAAPPPDGLVVWGTAWSAAGPASDDELRCALDHPATASSLSGRYLLAGRVGAHLRLVTSADVVHVLERVDHDGRTAWSTRGFGALAAAGRPVEVDPDAVAEVVLLDFVLGQRSLAKGVELVDEATWTDVDARGATAGTWWSRDDRLAPGPPTTPEGLCRAVTDAVVPVAVAEGGHLALTAGRDSLLVAGCLAGAGATMATFTMGHPAWPDAVGARAVAATLGWEHHGVVPAGPVAPSFAEACRWSAWVEGQVLARDTVGPALGWPAGLRVALSGSGGEIGRRFWAERGALLPTGAPATVVERVAAELAAFPGDERRQLDALYAFGRMRKWLARGRPVPGQLGTTAAYLGPEVVRCLLDLPPGGFDAALALDDHDLRAVAIGAIGSATARRSIRQRANQRLRPPVRGEVRDLEDMLAAAGHALDPVRAAVGEAWWRHATATVSTSTRSRLSLWNAVSVAALLTWAG